MLSNASNHASTRVAPSSSDRVCVCLAVHGREPLRYASATNHLPQFATPSPLSNACPLRAAEKGIHEARGCKKRNAHSPQRAHTCLFARRSPRAASASWLLTIPSLGELVLLKPSPGLFCSPRASLATAPSRRTRRSCRVRHAHLNRWPSSLTDAHRLLWQWVRSR